ncbi:MAG: ABC transporter ATP-binding protein [Thermoguttaceae bacterium]|nr:ABC transporter ATP-binding protein [Thermoguttaceae bacterium]MDW8037047.1 ABC transporter ATP-binding protein [Thermoguttaceae bacterium]
MPSIELIRLEEIRKTYYLGELAVPVLHGISLTIRAGEMVALMDASGSGKTTLMNILGCLDRPTSGQYWLAGQEMSRLSPNQRALVRSEKIGFVSQNFNLLPRTSALQNGLMPLSYSNGGLYSSEQLQWVVELLERVGLANHIHHHSAQMSGGQKQRVAIARALVNRPVRLLADEPTGNLDSQTSREILPLFQQLHAEGLTIVLVTHDPQVAAYAERIVRIADGRIIDDQTTRRVPLEVTDSAEKKTSGGLSIRNRSSDGAGARSKPSTNHPQHPTCCLPESGEPVLAMAVAEPPLADPKVTRKLFPLEPKESALKDETASVPGRAETALAAQRAEQPSRQTPPVRRSYPRRFSLWASLIPVTWRTAMTALWRHKMRSALSALGVIIAVAAVIAMTEIGQGAKPACKEVSPAWAPI